MRALIKLTWVEIKLFARDPSTVVFVFAFPLVVLLILQGVFGNTPEEEFRGAAPTDYYVPGYLAVVIASIGLIGVPVHLAAYRERGVLRRLHASSIPAWSIFGAQVAVSFVMATLASVLLLIAASLMYDTRMPESPARVLLAFGVSTLSFVALGFLLGSLLPNARAAQAAGLVLFFPMWLLSGAGPPRAVMTEPMRWISDVMPLTHVVAGLQDPWLDLGSGLTELLILAGILLAAGALSVYLGRRA